MMLTSWVFKVLFFYPFIDLPLSSKLKKIAIANVILLTSPSQRCWPTNKMIWWPSFQNIAPLEWGEKTGREKESSTPYFTKKASSILSKVGPFGFQTILLLLGGLGGTPTSPELSLGRGYEQRKNGVGGRLAGIFCSLTLILTTGGQRVGCRAVSYSCLFYSMF